MQLQFRWEVRLDVEPLRLWEYIADTGSLNRSAGLPPWSLEYVPGDEGPSRQVGEASYLGWRMRWDEHPFEWISGREYRVVRDYHNGPIRTFRMAVLLHPEGGGTRLEELIEAEPRWAVAAPGIYWEIGVRSRRRFERAYRRIERFLLDREETPFPPAPRQPLARERAQRLARSLAGVEGARWVPRLIEALDGLPDRELDRMRAFAFADRWGADRMLILRLFLHAAAAGLLDVSWDVICPSCRGAKARESKLADLRVEAHCDACNIRYDADFARSVEVTFRPNPAVRPIDVVVYCSGGPMNAPHVVAQQRLGPAETRRLALELEPFRYRVRSPALEAETVVRVAEAAPRSSVEVTLDPGGQQPLEAETAPGFDLVLANASGQTRTVMLERSTERSQVSTAALVTTIAEFRNLFSSEVLAPDTEVRAGTLSLMFTDLRASTSMYEAIGDTSAYSRVRQHFELLRAIVARHQGTFVKTIGDAVMAAFTDPAEALAAAFEMHERIRRDRRQPPLTLKIGIHQGPCFAVSMNRALDYFGTTVNVAARIQKESRGGDVVVSQELFGDPAARKVLDSVPHRHEELDIEIRGLSRPWRVHRLELEAE